MSKIYARAASRLFFSTALCLAFVVALQAQQPDAQAQHSAILTPTAFVVEYANSSTQTASVSSPAKFSSTPVSAAKETSKAKPVATSPVETYRIGSGDVLDIRLVNAPTIRASTLYTVLAGGLLEFPLIGDQTLNVNNLTTDEIAALLTGELKNRNVDFDPRIIVNVREFVSHTVLVNGLVESQGAQILRREAMPLYVVIAEAMPKRNAGRVTLVSRATNERRTIDFSDSPAMNALVRAGDVLIIEERPHEFFYIAGDVSAPGQKDFHARMTLTQAILAANGALHGKGTARLARQTEDGRLSFVEYNLKEIETGNAPDPRLQSGDRIEVVRH